jgi:hypothetical protein
MGVARAPHRAHTDVPGDAQLRPLDADHAVFHIDIERVEAGGLRHGRYGAGASRTARQSAVACDQLAQRIVGLGRIVTHGALCSVMIGLIKLPSAPWRESIFSQSVTIAAPRIALGKHEVIGIGHDAARWAGPHG